MDVFDFLKIGSGNSVGFGSGFLKDWIVLLSDVKMRRRFPERDFFRSLAVFLRFLDKCLDKAKIFGKND